MTEKFMCLLKKIISFIALLVFANLCYAAMPVNQEIVCKIEELSFFNNGVQTTKSSTPDSKPVYYKFDGRQLSAYYKLPDPPKVAVDGARFISKSNVKDGERIFDVTKFEKDGSMQHRIDVFRGVGGKTNILIMVDRYSTNNFVSFGQNTAVCQ